MGLMYEVLSAINNPNQQASIDQLSTLTNSVQQIASQTGIDASTTQSVMSSLGGFLRPALQQQLTGGGGRQLENMLGQIPGGNLLGGMMGQATGGNASAAALSSLVSPQLQQQIIHGIAQKTGLDAGMIQSLLPQLLPVVMNFLNMGASKTGSPGSNPILNAFLDSDRSGNTDLGDMMKFANRFLSAQYQPA